jgi:exocyst complex component 4
VRNIAPSFLFTHCTATPRFVFEGLGTLMEHLLISNSRHIRFANAVGIQKIMRNMLAMQQNLKTITDASQDADFERARAYWNLFSLQPAVCASFL